MSDPRWIDNRLRPSRRTFVKGLAACGAAASFGFLDRAATAAPGVRVDPAVLSGTEFALRIGETRVDVTGRPRTALTINGTMRKSGASR